MINWVLSIAGMAFLGVVVETLVPNGKISNFLKGVFSLFLMYVVIAPLPQLFNNYVEINTDYSYEESVSFLETFNSKKLENYRSDIYDKLKSCGIHNVCVEFDADITKSDIVIEKVFVDIQNIVLNEDVEHININETIENVIISVVEVENSEVIIYGQSGLG